MEFQLPIQIATLPRPIGYGDKILLAGSCFTEHIGNALRDWKFNTLTNPNGILFDPASVSSSLQSYLAPRYYAEDDLVFFNELWQSWQHHSIFSHPDRTECLRRINASQQTAHDFLRQAGWLIITLGSAFSYRLAAGGAAVANCHRAPAQTFSRHFMTIEEIMAGLDACLHRLFYFNPDLQIIFTVSPVRHIRDGVIDNNRSKARLIESVHQLAGKFDRVYYFPAYELVIDVLRDYRFYDIDLVHPNYAATAFVLEKFVRHCIDEPGRSLLEEVGKLVAARRHKPFHPTTQAHRRFLREQWQKATELAERYPFLDLSEELDYFSGGAINFGS
ncbi:MAG TPA: GSCFA domain-containing protein [Puia sp.]|nr:GSCFA domain-containing protein [Puia sp.]